MKVGIIVFLYAVCAIPATAQNHDFPISKLEPELGMLIPRTLTPPSYASFSERADFDPGEELCWPDEFELLAPDQITGSFQSSRLEAPNVQSRNDNGSNITPGGPKPERLPSVDDTIYLPIKKSGFHWRNAIAQSLFFLSIEHGFRLLDPAQSDTKSALRGPFFKDWFRTVSELRGWRDGDNAMINYVGHPVGGAVSGRIQIQNDPQGTYLELARSRAYLNSRLKAFAFAAAYSLQFELGPLSEASIGNASPTPASPHPTSYVDLVVTPVLGMAWLVSEDAIDRYLIRGIESLAINPILKKIARTFLNPSRAMSNALRFKWPWYRDTR